MVGLDRAAREVIVAPYIDEDGDRSHAGAPLRLRHAGDRRRQPHQRLRHAGRDGARDLRWRRRSRRSASTGIWSTPAFRAHAQAEPLAAEQLDVAIIGAGATGVELAAELHNMTRTLVRIRLRPHRPGARTSSSS